MVAFCMRRPLVIVALLYAAGLLLAETAQPPLIWLFAIAGPLLGFALACPRGRPWLLMPLVLLLGWINLLSHTVTLSPRDVRAVVSSDPAEVIVRGTLEETPSVRVFLRDDEESFRTLAVVRLTALQRGATWLPVTGRILTTTPDRLDDLYRGTAVEVRGVIAPPPEPVAVGLFDYRVHLARQGIYFQLKTYSTNAWRALSPATPPLADRFIAWAKHTLARGQPAVDEPLRLLYAMTLGWKTGLTNEVYAPFMKSGTMHIFAISGLHIALIAGLLVAILRVLQIPRHWCGAVVIPLIWFYTAATGWQPSAIRSTIMMTIIIGGWSLGRPSDLLNSLAAAALIILVWQPQQLFQASFQLSFFVVLSIALLVPPLQRLADRLLAHDPLLPREVLPRWRRWLETALRWPTMSFATSLAAWLGSLPLTMHYFHLFSPVTLLANLVIVPMSSCALASALGSLLCGGWLPGVGELFNQSAWFWMSTMVHASHWATTLPGAFCYVPSPPAWGYVAYYTLLIGALSGWFWKRPNWRWGGLAAALTLAGVAWEWQRARTQFDVTVVPLSGGHAAWVDGPGRADDWLIDCGNSNAVTFVTEPLLHALGVNRLPRLALTHGDLQHVGGADLIRADFQAPTVYTSPVRFRSAAYRAILDELAAAPEQHVTLCSGDRSSCWTVLHPAADDKFAQADDAGLVLRGEFFGTRVLLLADLGRPGQEALLRRAADLRADIVVAGLPEQGEALCDGLITAIQPRLIVVADSQFPATKRASLGLRQRLAASGVRVLCTRETGAVTLRFRPEGWQVTTAFKPPAERVISDTFADAPHTAAAGIP